MKNSLSAKLILFLLYLGNPLHSMDIGKLIGEDRDIEQTETTELEQPNHDSHNKRKYHKQNEGKAKRTRVTQVKAEPHIINFFLYDFQSKSKYTKKELFEKYEKWARRENISDIGSKSTFDTTLRLLESRDKEITEIINLYCNGQDD